MAKIIKPISVDVARENTYIYILAKQGDAVSRYLEIAMLNEGEPIDITGATSATLTAVKSDKTVTLTAGTIANGKVTVELTKQTLAVDGPVQCYLSVVAGGSILSTLNFTVSVQATNVDEDKIISSDEYTAFQEALTALGDINTLRSDVDKAKQDAEKSAVAAAKSANDAADAVETAMGNVLPIETEDISDGSVTPEKTSFVKPKTYKMASNLETGGFHIEDSSDLSSNSVAIDSSKEYTLYNDWNVASVRIGSLSGGYRTIALTDLPQISYLDYDGAETDGRLIAPVSGDADIKVIFAENTTDQATIRELSRAWDVFSIPDLLLSNNNIADGTITMPKLSADVREALSGALKRKIVSVLPEADGEVLVKRTEPYSAGNDKGSDLVTTNWVAFDGAADVTPVASTKRLRFTLHLSTTLEGGSCRGGQVRLRRYQDYYEYGAAVCSIPASSLGDTEMDIPLINFTGAPTSVLEHINEIMVFVYANGISSDTPAGAYTIGISNVRIVDTAVQDALDTNTIYMVPTADPQISNAYDEYMYIGSAWERIGSTAMDLSNYYTKSATDAAIRDAMYTVVDATANSDGTYSANGIKLSISGDHAVVGDGSGDIANALWITQELIIPAYIRIPSGEVYAVTEIGASSLTCNALTMSFEYLEARVYIPRTVKTYGSYCFAQYYGDASGHLHIVADSPVAPRVYDSATTTVYRLDNPLGVVDLATKAEVTAKVGDIDTALDAILAIQTSLIGGDA